MNLHHVRLTIFIVSKARSIYDVYSPEAWIEGKDRRETVPYHSVHVYSSVEAIPFSHNLSNYYVYVLMSSISISVARPLFCVFAPRAERETPNEINEITEHGIRETEKHEHASPSNEKKRYIDISSKYIFSKILIREITS